MRKSDIHPEIYRVLRQIGRFADLKGYKAFCVGGFVRDMLLGVRNFDFDVVIEDKGIKFARELAALLQGALVVHERFGTATVVVGSFYRKRAMSRADGRGLKIDVATARREYYEHPAALPKVVFGSIRHDLYRRDFTINAMAVSLNKGTFGHLIDFFGGQKDLRNRKIRALHDMSFIDDPTRIFRAVRFEQRLGFRIEPHTKSLIEKAVKIDMFAKTKSERLRNEIVLILTEPRPFRALKRMSQLHELKFIHPKIRPKKKMLELLKKIERLCNAYTKEFTDRPQLERWIIYFMAMIEDVGIAQTRLLCERFAFRKVDKKKILSCKRKSKRIVNAIDKNIGLTPSRICRHLSPLSDEVIVFILAKAKTKEAKRGGLEFLRTHGKVRLSISGSDLEALGLRPGPRYREILEKVLHAKIDKKLRGRQDELKLARRLSRGQG